MLFNRFFNAIVRRKDYFIFRSIFFSLKPNLMPYQSAPRSLMLFRLLSLFAITTVITISGCDTDPTDLEILNQNGSMSAEVDGRSWTSFVAVAGTVSAGILAFGGTDLAGTAIVIAVPAVEGPHEISSSASSAVYREGVGSDDLQWSATTGSGTGTIAISSLTSTSAEGSFFFDGQPDNNATSGVKQVRRGTFKIKFQAAE